MTDTTTKEYQEAIAICKELFSKKTIDYGTSWRVLRIPSITDQIFIKARRIRSVQEKGKQLVEDDVKSEFIGIINYCIIAIIQISLENDAPLEISWEELEPKYDEAVSETRHLLSRKNHDYDEAWREMRINSMTDIILMKLLRVKQMEDNQGQTIISEGIKANYQDMMNYAIFCMIKMKTA